MFCVLKRAVVADPVEVVEHRPVRGPDVRVNVYVRV